jgi:hypothetical protein
MTPPSEQRRYPRFPIAYKVKLVVDDRIIVYPTAIDLSMGGILVGGPDQVPVGTLCGIAILLGDGRNVVARGTVVRSDGRGMAIHFAKALEPASEEALLSLIRSIHQIAIRTADPGPAGSLDGTRQVH